MQKGDKKMKKMNIEQWKEMLKDHKIEWLEEALTMVLSKIKLLESIYMSDGENYYYSTEFNDQAYTERQHLCQFSSALFSLLREKGVDTDKFYAFIPKPAH